MSAPTVVGIDPASGPAGTQVVITGTGFTEDASTVHFGAASAGTRFAVISATQILAYAPAGAGTVHVTVTTPGGTSATGAGDQFTYAASVGPPGGGGGSAPTVTSVVPDTAVDNDGGDVVAVHGTGFTTTIAVRFGVAAESAQGVFTVVSDAELSVLTPPGFDVVDVIVVNSYGESAVGSADAFTYPAPPAPTITGFTPAHGGAGAAVTVTGTNFESAAGAAVVTEVSFAGALERMPAEFTVQSATSLVCYVPEDAVTGAIEVTSDGGTVDSAAAFTADGSVYQVIQATADGKNHMTHSLSAPSVADANIAGDVWFRYDALTSGGHVIAQWTGGGGSAGAYVWTPTLLSDALFTSVSCAKLAAGTVSVAIELTSATITGALIRTSTGEKRVEIVNNDTVAFYDGVAGHGAGSVEGDYAYIYSGTARGLARIPAIVITAPDDGVYAPAVLAVAATGEVSVSDDFSVGGGIDVLGGISLGGSVVADVNISAAGLIKCHTNYTIGGDTGITLQDNNGLSTRWRLYYNSSANKLAIRKVGDYATVFQSAVLNG